MIQGFEGGWGGKGEGGRGGGEGKGEGEGEGERRDVLCTRVVLSKYLQPVCRYEVLFCFVFWFLVFFFWFLFLFFFVLCEKDK